MTLVGIEVSGTTLGCRRDRVVVCQESHHGEISAHFAEIYGGVGAGADVSRITENVTAEMAEWASRP